MAAPVGLDDPRGRQLDCRPSRSDEHDHGWRLRGKTHLARLLERVERGEESTITRRGKAVARLVPVTAVGDREAALATFRRLRERAKQLELGKFDWPEWKAYVDEGRP